MILQRSLRQFMQLARLDISVELPIPKGGIEFGEPRPQRLQFLLRERFYLTFDLLYTAHNFASLTSVQQGAYRCRRDLSLTLWLAQILRLQRVQRLCLIGIALQHSNRCTR
jgi:hypothetical protein